MNLPYPKDALMEALEEIVFSETAQPKRRTQAEKRKRKKQIKRAHRGTNWKQLGSGKLRKGFKRIKLGDKTYSFVRQTPSEKVKKRQIGRKLGKAKYLK